jgi:acyl-CoA synthetase (AMP-forming)/AMP-acid ligase II
VSVVPSGDVLLDSHHRNRLTLLQTVSVDDCIVVGQKTPDGDERVILFVKPQQGKELSSATVKQIKDTIATRLSRRHVPAKVIECPGEGSTCLLSNSPHPPSHLIV